jgi:hypothetical protein
MLQLYALRVFVCVFLCVAPIPCDVMSTRAFYQCYTPTTNAATVSTALATFIFVFCLFYQCYTPTTSAATAGNATALATFICVFFVCSISATLLPPVLHLYALRLLL